MSKTPVKQPINERLPLRAAFLFQTKIYYRHIKRTESEKSNDKNQRFTEVQL